MKLLKITFAAVVALAFQNAYAFHSGGVAECAGCHSMHSAAGSYLLVGGDQSSTCLTCHQNATATPDTGPNGYHIWTPDSQISQGAGGNNPLQRTPGGDFAWLKKNWSWAGEGGVTETETGDSHGHNVVAIDKGYTADATNLRAPGGGATGFNAANLACNSCHDPHGQYRRLTTGAIAKTGAPIYASGSYSGTNVAANEPTATEAVGVYRLLAGAGYTKGGVTFTGVPAAKVPSTYNASEATAQIRVAYGTQNTNGHASWGQWCGTCHSDMQSLTQTTNTHGVHPVDVGFSSDYANNYNSYVKSGDLTGAQATSYSSLVPFAISNATYADLATAAKSTGGPKAGDQVMCLSCHRAHASAFPEGLRWQMEYEFITKAGGYIGLDNPAVTGSRAPIQARGRYMVDNQAGYYDRPATQFATYQRLLCNKCHAKD